MTTDDRDRPASSRDSMLRQMLGPTAGWSLREDGFRRAPRACPGEALALSALVTPEAFVDLALKAAEGDVLVVKNGRPSTAPAPRSRTEAHSLHRAGHSVVLRNVHRLDQGLGRLAEDLSAELGAAVAVQLCRTPAWYHSFTWRCDAEEMVIVQAHGTGDYYLRENTVARRPPGDPAPGDGQYAQETSPTLGSTLTGGDWLYVPSGWWRIARARRDSLTLSVGLAPRSATETLPG